MNHVSRYIARSVSDVIIASGVGLAGLHGAIDAIHSGHGGAGAGIVERGPVVEDTAQWEGTILAVASRTPLLGLGERGHLLITREMTTVERVYINHFSEKLSWLDLSQVGVDYAYRCSDLETTSEFRRGLSGLEAAVRGVRTEGFGFLIRRIEGIPGEQPIAVCSAAGNYFTKSADERERRLIQTVREAMEYYGEFPPARSFDDPETRVCLLDALALANQHASNPLTQASALHNVAGRASGLLSAVLGAVTATTTNVLTHTVT